MSNALDYLGNVEKKGLGTLDVGLSEIEERSRANTLLLPHNYRVYDDVKDTLLKNKLAVLVTCMGTGKSYITAEFIKKTQNVALIISPVDLINDEWQILAQKHGLLLDVATYQGIARLKDEEIDELLQKYDLVVCDEAHHVEAAVWSINLKKIRDKILASCDKYMLGLTADPIRYTDNNIDVSSTFFGDFRVDGYDLAEALDQEILPTFKYISCMYTLEKEAEAIDVDLFSKENREMVTELKHSLKLSLENMLPMKQIIEKRLNPDVPHKIIIFAERIEDISYLEQCFNYLAKPENIFRVSSKDSDNEITIENFKACQESAVLIGVNMLTQGLHIDGVDTLIMLRKTQSPNVFKQQIGRLTAAGQTGEKICFDFVGNSNNVRVYDRVTEMQEQMNFIAEVNKRIRKKSNQIIVEDFSREPLEILERLRMLQLSLEPWTEEEDAILREYYPTEGIEVVERLSNRSESAVYNRVHVLKLKCLNGRWLEEELTYLKTNSAELSLEELLEMLPRHDKRSIWAKINELGLEYVKYFKAYTEDEEKVIREWYPIEGADCVKRLGTFRTKAAVTQHANKLGLEVIFTPKWSDVQLNEVKTMYENGCSYKDICSKFGVSKSLASHLIGKVSEKHRVVRRFSETEDKCILEAIVLGMSYKEICDKLNTLDENRDTPRGSATVRGYVRKKFGSQSSLSYWTAEEELLLKENAINYSVRDLSEKILPNKSVGQIYQKLQRLGIEYKHVK